MRRPRPTRIGILRSMSCVELPVESSHDLLPRQSARDVSAGFLAQCLLNGCQDVVEIHAILQEQGAGIEFLGFLEHCSCDQSRQDNHWYPGKPQIRSKNANELYAIEFGKSQ